MIVLENSDHEGDDEQQRPFESGHESPYEFTTPDEPLTGSSEYDVGSGEGESPYDRTAGLESDDLLRWMLPELNSIEEECSVLLSSAEPARHDAAARSILTSLNVGARGILDLNLQPPDPVPGNTNAEESRKFVHKLGTLLDKQIKGRDLSWPPPLPEPPPAVTRDLLYLYEHAASGGTLEDEVPAIDQLRNVLSRIDQLSSSLLDDWGPSAVAVARTMAQPAAGSPRSRIGMFLSGAALAISLLQGPGAMHNFARDAVLLGSDIASVASRIVTGIAKTAKDIESGIAASIGEASRQVTDSAATTDRSSRSQNRHLDANPGNYDGQESTMNRLIATLRSTMELLPNDSLEESVNGLQTAIQDLHVLKGSKDEQQIHAVAHDALLKTQDAHRAVQTLHAQLAEWVQTRGG